MNIMYINTYICIYIYVCIYIYKYVYIYIYTYGCAICPASKNISKYLPRCFPLTGGFSAPGNSHRYETQDRGRYQSFQDRRRAEEVNQKPQRK